MKPDLLLGLIMIAILSGIAAYAVVGLTKEFWSRLKKTITTDKARL